MYRVFLQLYGTVLCAVTQWNDVVSQLVIVFLIFSTRCGLLMLQFVNDVFRRMDKEERVMSYAFSYK